MLIDIILIIFIISGFWWGYTHGLGRVLLNIVLYIPAIIITLLTAPWLADFLSSVLPMGKLFALLFGTIGLFILYSFILFRLTKALDKKLGAKKVIGRNNIPAGIIMLLFSILIYGLLLGALDATRWLNNDIKQTSVSYPALKSIPIQAGKVVEISKPVFKNYWQLLQETVKESQPDA